MATIEHLSALEILDSRGRPTLQARCTLFGGVQATISVPSGASTGAAEAIERRDGDPKRYRGLGCRQAVASINDELNHLLHGQAFATQAELDRWLIQYDGTPNKSRLGGNTLLAVSLAYAKACAAAADLPLYRHFSGLLGTAQPSLPMLTVNLFSGGKHAGGQVSIQDVLVVPVGASTIDEALAWTYEVYQCAASYIYQHYGQRALTADEGGLAPNFPTIESMLDATVNAIHMAGFTPGREVALAIDVASSHFYTEGFYTVQGSRLSGGEMVDLLERWVTNYPIISLEDGLAEEDWQHWQMLYDRAGHQIAVMGDDLLCTNPARIRSAIEHHSANALLLKVNQIGTLTEAAEAYTLARTAGWRVTVSARSGETEDHWLADLAVGWGGDEIKIGSITRSERLAKYNRLLAIEREAPELRLRQHPRAQH